MGRFFIRGCVMSTYGGSTLHAGVCNDYLRWVVSSLGGL